MAIIKLVIFCTISLASFLMLYLSSVLLLKFYYYMFAIILLYVLLSFIYSIVLFKNNTEFDLYLYDKKSENNEIYYPHHLFLDILNYFYMKKFCLIHLFSFFLFLALFPIINLYVASVTTVFYVDILLYTTDIVYFLIINKSVEIKISKKKNNNLLDTGLSISNLFAFSTVYAILKGDVSNIKIINSLKLIFLSRVYGKPLLIIKVFVIVFITIKECLENIEWKSKHMVAWPSIFLYEFFSVIKYKLNNVINNITWLPSKKRIIIGNRKIRLNPTHSTDLVAKSKNFYENFILRVVSINRGNFLERYHIHGDVNLKDVKNNFGSVRLKGINHLCRKICDISNDKILMTSYSSKDIIRGKDLSIIENKGSPALNNYYEGTFDEQISSEKYSFVITSPKNLFKQLPSPKILDYYTAFNINYAALFDLHEYLKFVINFNEKKVTYIEHDKTGHPTNSKINPDRDIGLANMARFVRDGDNIDKLISDYVSDVVKNNKDLVADDPKIVADELGHYLKSHILTRPTIVFQDQCAEALANDMSDSSIDNFENVLSQIKNFIRQ